MAFNADLVIRNGTIVDGTGGETFEGDVAISDGKIIAVGRGDAWQGKEEIDAKGLLVTPGFVDIHTHYDGQATWEDRLSPSSWHGVTTAVMGNCGVGFAPCRPADHENLIRLMEGVEDIPEVVMASGLPWNWETYPEYLDAVEKRAHDIDLVSLLPHSALRVYVMGQRGIDREAATSDDIARMVELTGEAMLAGAIGFATSRTIIHRSRDGDLIPTFGAAEAELEAIALALKKAGHGIIELATDFNYWEDVPSEFSIYRRISELSGVPVTFGVAEMHSKPDVWREVIGLVEKANDEDVNIKVQVFPRPTGLVLGFDLSANPFCLCPTYKALSDLPFSERVVRLRDPEIRARIISEPPADHFSVLLGFVRQFDRMFALGEVPKYDPGPAATIAAQAAVLGVSPEALAYDILLGQEGRATLFLPFTNYAHGNLDAARALMLHRDTILGLGDGGAHYGMICDASYPTSLLTYWTRDRPTDRLPLAWAIKQLSRDTAHFVGLRDRGVLAPGYKADLNIIDYDRLSLGPPKAIFDLPAGGRRLTQRAAGFVASIVSGTVTYREGVPTGALPGRLVRGPQRAPV